MVIGPVVQQIVARATEIEYISASLQVGSADKKSLRATYVCWNVSAWNDKIVQGHGWYVQDD